MLDRFWFWSCGGFEGRLDGLLGEGYVFSPCFSSTLGDVQALER